MLAIIHALRALFVPQSSRPPIRYLGLTVGHRLDGPDAELLSPLFDRTPLSFRQVATGDDGRPEAFYPYPDPEVSERLSRRAAIALEQRAADPRPDLERLREFVAEARRSGITDEVDDALAAALSAVEARS